MNPADPRSTAGLLAAMAAFGLDTSPAPTGYYSSRLTPAEKAEKAAIRARRKAERDRKRDQRRKSR